jgi:hypothetical protein
VGSSATNDRSSRSADVSGASCGSLTVVVEGQPVWRENLEDRTGGAFDRCVGAIFNKERLAKDDQSEI